LAVKQAEEIAMLRVNIDIAGSFIKIHSVSGQGPGAQWA
jgi:hypothetical protein